MLSHEEMKDALIDKIIKMEDCDGSLTFTFVLTNGRKRSSTGEEIFAVKNAAGLLNDKFVQNKKWQKIYPDFYARIRKNSNQATPKRR